MADIAALFPRAVSEFDRRVLAVGDDHWSQPTPCADWDVRALVNHLVYENRWAVPLLQGATIAEVGDQFEGDLVGDDPKGAWADASSASVEAASGEGLLSDTVHLSF